MSLFAELRRRNVFRVGIAYVLMGWVLLQGADFVLDLVGAPEWFIRALAVVVAIGLPIALFFAWAFELTPEGIKRDAEVDRSHSIAPRTGRTLDRVIIGLLVLAVVVLLGERYWGAPEATGLPDESAAPSDTAWVAAPPEDGRASVAVLPFDFRSNNPDDEFFAEGIHDDLLTQLAKIGSLKVISRTSVMEYRDTTKKIPQIAAELGVAAIVEGGVQRSGSRIRLNVQLIDAVTDEHRWAETFDRELTAENLFDIQAEISRAIASALKATLSPSEEAQLDQSLTRNLEAWESYRRAIAFRQTQSNAAIISGLEEIEHALSLDPGFAAAHGLKAILLLQRYWFFDRDPALRDQAWQVIEAGRRIDPHLAELDLAEAYYHYWGFLDYASALVALDRAVLAQPGNFSIHEARAFVLRRMGRWDEALQSFRRAIELNPRDGSNLSEMGALLSVLKRFPEAEEALNKGIELNPNSAVPMAQMGQHQFIAHGDLDEARRYFRMISSTVAEAYQWYWEIVLADRDFEAADRMIDDWPESLLEVRVYQVTRPMLRGLLQTYAGQREAASLLLAPEISRFESMLAANPGAYTLMQSLCQMHGAMGHTQQAIEFCGMAHEHLPPDAFIKGSNLMTLSGGLAMAGADAAALEMIAEALAYEAGPTIHSFELYPAFDGLRDNPRFQALIDDYRHVVQP